MRTVICLLSLPDLLRLRGGVELALEPARGGLGVGELPSRQPLSLSASLDSGTLLASGPYATPRELKNLPWSQLLPTTVGPVVLVPEGPWKLAGSLAYSLGLMFFPGHIF